MRHWVRHIRGWAGWTAIREWQGWRRYSPAAGSIIAHAVVGAALIGIMAASVKPRPALPPLPLSPQLEVTLVAETPRSVPRPPPPRVQPRPPAAPDAEAIPDKPRPSPRKDEKHQPDAAAPDDNTVFVPPSIFTDNVPLGLRSLLESDPCKPKNGLPRGDCGPSWTEKFASNDFQITPTEAQLRRMYPGIIPPCPYKVGCEGGEWVSTNGTRSVFSPRGDPMMSGAGGLTTGAESTTERLGFNPDHIDPGFGD